jgi:hypothetical protein
MEGDDMSKHTPGPWTAIPDDDGDEDNWYVLTEKEAAIAVGLYGPDARLIAAAPDLLAVLQDLADVSRGYLEHMDAEDIAALEAARAAIAKAEGGS